jgi:transcriptional regulator with XRE-family HTH domain
VGVSNDYERARATDDLAVHLDMNRGHLSNIERDKREAGIITLQVIARGLNTTMANQLKGL